MNSSQLAELRRRLQGAATDEAGCTPNCMWRAHADQLLAAIDAPDAITEGHLEDIHQQLMEERTPGKVATLGEDAGCHENCAWRDGARGLYHHVVTLRRHK